MITPVFSIASEHLRAKHPGWDIPAPLNPFSALNPESHSQKGTSPRTMPKPTVKSVSPQTRCKHIFPASGHQCRLLASDPQSGLCTHHLAKKRALDKHADFYGPLAKHSVQFQTAQGINHSLGQLYELVARDRISARRASTLACISSLLLRTLPAIDNDNDSDITLASCSPDPSRPPSSNSIPDPGPSIKPS